MQLKTKELSSEWKAGYDIVIRSCKEPLRQIVLNTGEARPDVILDAVECGASGYDAKIGMMVDDMFKSGIIDPLRVTRMALENAVSIAALVLTTETVVVDNEKPE